MGKDSEVTQKLFGNIKQQTVVASDEGENDEFNLDQYHY